MLYSLIYYLCFSSIFIVFVLTVFLIRFNIENLFVKIILLMLLAGCLVTAWSFFIERHWIRVTEMNLNKGWNNTVVVIADQHLGVYKSRVYMDRVVAKINTLENIDAVLIAGDLTYRPQDLEYEQAALANIKFPTYTVLGNHDVLESGYISHEATLVPLLEQWGVESIENKTVTTASGLTLTGLSDHWAGQAKLSLLAQLDITHKNIIVAHNPDAVLFDYPHIDLSGVVTVSGHTHCGQIRIPWLYKKVIPTVGNFPDQGPYDLGTKGTLAITCGLGEVILPLRLFNRPEILVLHL